MPPSSPWGKKPHSNNSSSGFPGLKSTTLKTEPPEKSQYEEIQDDELIALASIYGEDFRSIEGNQVAWQKSEPSFEIRIKSSDEDIAMTLAATFTATYPKSPPLLSIKNDGSLRESTKFKLQKVIETKPKELVVEEQAMIMEIVNACQDILEDAAQAKAAGQELPSLEEERAAHEAAAAKLAEENRKEEEKKRTLENLEEERMLGSLVQEEIRRQKAKAKETKRKNRPPSALIQTPIDDVKNGVLHNFLEFDQPIKLDMGSPIAFQIVSGKRLIRSGPVSKCFTVWPLISQGSDEDLPTLILKQTDLRDTGNDHTSFKRQLQALETEFEALKKLRHQNILQILDFKVHKSGNQTEKLDSAWTVSSLCEFADKGSLEEFLDIVGDLGVVKVRSWTIELLDALRYLHDNGILHEDIHAGNVLLVRNFTGEFRLKLADAGCQRKLHFLAGKKQATDTISLAKSAYWFPPEIANTEKPQYTQKTDVWDFGVLFLQMAFGLNVIRKYSSPISLADSLPLSDSLHEFVQKLFKADPKKRPRAFELSSFEFLATDAPILDEDISSAVSRLGSISSLPSATRRPRHDSMNTGGPFSRYKEDFVEEGRLGKGGFGEVVKARKKLDGQIYAIKKITQKSSASLTEVLKEVRMLSQLSHPSVVRYYNTWTEEVISDVSEADDNVSTSDAPFTEDSTNEVSPGIAPEIEFGVSTGGLDFMSSSGYPQVEFGYDEGSDVFEEDEDGTDDDSTSFNERVVKSPAKERNNLVRYRTKSNSRYQRPFKTILYISMEYCEKRTLRDLIKRDLHRNDEEIWRLFRQVLEGLVHIHGLNVVHRDLKPENIFIDAASNVKIGDFGLATSGQYSMGDRLPTATTSFGGDMTRSIGTAAYVAPEVKSNVGGSYTSKVDMYSLGVIFFEMCYKPIVGMERAQVVEDLRKKQPILPTSFDTTGKAVQANIILSLLSHSPKERSSSSELLQGGKLPVQMESETIRQTLAGLSDPRSPYYHKMMAALFSQPTKHAKDVAWDMDIINPSDEDLLFQGIAKQKLISIFRHHGAIETPRSALFPRSGHYALNVVQLLDANGILVQLPYDLTLPHARAIAKHEPSVQKSFAFAPVYRDRQSGGQPQSYGEVDFDIVSTDTLDLALKEAEVLKVLDEVVLSFPALASTQMCIHLNHSDLLDLIYDFCRIDTNTRQLVSDTLSKLNVQQWTWPKIRNELRSPLIAIPATSVDDLERFDFRDSPAKAFQKLKSIFQDADTYERAASSIAHLRDVIEYTKRFGVKTKIYIRPLESLKERFCKGGVVFSCVYDRKLKDVFAVGGRYDSLIREYRHKTGTNSAERHAVGFNLAWEKLARLPKSNARGFLKKFEEELQGIWTTRRCDVLVASHDPVILRTGGVEIVQQLWDNEISTELAQDSRSPEELLTRHRDDHHSWIVIIKQDSVLKVKSMRNKDTPDVDIPTSSLVTWLLAEMKERDQRDNTVHRGAKLQRYSQNEGAGANDHESDVRVLVAGNKTKKSNRRKIVEQAQGRAVSLSQSFLDGPIAAIETTDEVMELLRGTKLSDPDSWRKATHAVPTTERRYLGEVHDLMNTLSREYKEKTRNAFIYNFRTGMCIYYDLAE